MLYITFIQELEKIAAQGGAGSTLELHSNPYGLGMHAKREGDRTKGSYRPLAYTQAVPTAAAAGLASGAIAGPLTEGRVLNLFTPKGQKLLKDKFKQDVDTLQKDLSTKTKVRYAVGGKAMIGKALFDKATGKKLDPQDKQALDNIGKVVKRRLGKIAPGALRGAAFAAGAKGLYNIGSFETAKALTPGLSEKRRKK